MLSRRRSNASTAEDDSKRILFAARCVSAALTTVYALCALTLTYWSELGLSSFADDAFGNDEERRRLQGNGTLDYDPYNCTFPRADNKIIPNPKCSSLASLITIPFVNAIIGAGTNWLALKMTFYPTRYVGINLYRFKDQPLGLFGWQGIIPTKAAKMAKMSVQMMTEKLFDVNEIFKRVDPKVSVDRMKPGFTKVMNEILEGQIGKMFPPDSRFASFAPTIKSQMLSWSEAEMPEFAEGFMADLIVNLDKVFDLEYMVVNEFTENKQLLNDVFITVGANELQFIINSGYIFGFLFGALFLPIWIFFPYWFVLPLVGGVVGYATNDIALRMMFKPIHPHYIKLGCCTLNFQGVFLKRQQEASAVFAELTVKQILHSRYMFHYMLNGPKRTAFRALLVEHTNKYVDKVLGRSHTLVRAYMGEEEFLKMRKEIEEQTMANVEDIFGSLYTYTDEALRLEEEIRTKMQALPPGDFEGVLHPVFQEDELKLILVGMVLGIVVGFIQITFP